MPKFDDHRPRANPEKQIPGTAAHNILEVIDLPNLSEEQEADLQLRIKRLAVRIAEISAAPHRLNDLQRVELRASLSALGAIRSKRNIPGLTANTVQNALLHGAREGIVAIVDCAIKEGADVNHVYEGGRTALHIAVIKGDSKTVKQLCDARANVYAPDNHQQTPAHLAASHGKAEAMKILVEAHTDLSSEDIHGNTPAWLATDRGHHAVLCVLKDSGMNMMQVNAKGATLMHAAAARGHIKVMDQLCNMGLDPFARDKDGQTPLDYAQIDGHEGAVEWLANKNGGVKHVTPAPEPG